MGLEGQWEDGGDFGGKFDWDGGLKEGKNLRRYAQLAKRVVK